jgi:preprotein translocase subunit YajC
MLISPAHAQAAGGATGGGDIFVQLMPLVLIFVVFYFLLIRPQQQRAKQHRAMVEALKKGDQVVTAGGIFGRVSRVEAGDAAVMVEIAPNVQVKVARSTIGEVVGKPAAPTSNDNRTSPASSTAAPAPGIAGGLASRVQRFLKK